MTDPARRTLSQLFASATRQASEAMCRWTRGQVTLAIDEFRDVPLDEYAAETDLTPDLLTMVVLGIEGGREGQLILAFDDANGRRLAASLLGRPLESGGPWTTLEKSAVMETGNILGSAYLSALSRLAGEKLVPSPPCFIQDFGPSVLQQALVTQAMTTDRVMICRTRFEFNRERLDWNVFFVPSGDLLGLMHHSIQAAT
jgi:chemotaxis protein CheC